MGDVGRSSGGGLDTTQSQTGRNEPLFRAKTKSVTCRICDGSHLATGAVIDGFEHVTCKTCGFSFIPAFTPEDAQNLYAAPLEGVPDYGWAPDATFLDPGWTLLGRRTDLLILDFGSGYSMLPDALREAGNRVITVDVSPPRSAHPDRLTEDLLRLGLDMEQFDLVYSYQVFEHLPQPRPYLDELLRLTRLGGLVVIHSNMDTPMRTERLEDWFYACPPYHCSLFRQRTFEKAAQSLPSSLVWQSPWYVILRRERSPWA